MAAAASVTYFPRLLVLFGFCLAFHFEIVVLCNRASEWSLQHSRQPYVNFVLVGATGNLAQKYLWQGLYDLQHSAAVQQATSPLPDNVHFALYGGARSDNSTGTETLKGILKSRVEYAGDSEDERVSFEQSVAYVQLKTCQDYESFCEKVLNSNGQQQESESDGYCQTDSCGPLATDSSSWEIGRVFYLAVTPYSYGELAECIHRVCRPPSPKSWLRLVLEKPYGSDLGSVTALTTSLLQNFAEEEVYLIDHYLGKAAVKQILPFRYNNREWLEPLLSNEFVERIEVVMKEKEDAEGRLQFYDSYGVFLDILQNHAMEMLTLIAMDLPPDLEDPQVIRDEKIRFLKTVAPIHPRHLVAGQYSDYILHGQQQFKDDLFSSRTATFGAVLLRAPSSRWHGVPIILMSGKALDEKTSYIRVMFKDSAFDLENQQVMEGKSSGPKEFIVTINSQSTQVLSPSISISKSILEHLPLETVATSWPKVNYSSGNHVTFHYRGEDRAYSVVVSDIVSGRRDSFVGLEQLTASWNMWSLVVNHLNSIQPRHYESGDVESLRFHWQPNGVEFVDYPKTYKIDQSLNEVPDRFLIVKRDETATDSFVVPVIVKPRASLMEQLANELLKDALESKQQKRPFHVAFPGGTTPKPLFHFLASETLFPWEHTHVWFVDERCVPLSHPESNALNAQEQLLKYVGVPDTHIHRMPVDLARGLCHPEDLGAQLYETWLKQHLDSVSLDDLVLGVGADGHIASIFPQTSDSGSDQSKDESSWVKLSKAPSAASIQDRMTITLDTIRQARKVFIVITGKAKHDIVEHLLDGDQQAKLLPVHKVLDREGVTLYIDQDAYEG